MVHQTNVFVVSLSGSVVSTATDINPPDKHPVKIPRYNLTDAITHYDTVFVYKS